MVKEKAKKKYSFKDHPEHEAQLATYKDKWIANAMSTKAMDDYDKAQMRIAIKGLYESAGLTPPPEHRIIFVPSPFVARFAGGFAAAIWWLRKNPNVKLATADATDAAIRDATDGATADVTYNATIAVNVDATVDATDVTTYDATYAATVDATYDATDDATVATTYTATYAATDDAKIKPSENWFNLDISMMINLSEKLGLGKFGLQCAHNAASMYQGGNFWSGLASCLGFFKDVVKLDIDYTKYGYWEMATIHGSYRIMHPEFCIVSDRPEILTVDEQNRPHGEKNPFCRWRDGTALYAWHGIEVPVKWVENPESLTPKIALTWDNIEQRRAACEMLGWHNILKELNASVIDKGVNSQIGELLEVDLPGFGRERFLRVECGTSRESAIPVPLEIKTAREGNAWAYGLQPGSPSQ